MKLALIALDSIRRDGQMSVVERPSIELRKNTSVDDHRYPRTNGADHQRSLRGWRLLKVDHS